MIAMIKRQVSLLIFFIVILSFPIQYSSSIIPFRVSITIDNVTFEYGGWYSESIKSVEIMWDDVVIGKFIEILIIEWENAKGYRQLVANNGSSHSVGSVSFQSEGPFLTIQRNITVINGFLGKVRIEKNTTTTLNTTLTFSYISSKGGLANMYEEYINGVLHNAVGCSFRVTNIGFNSEARLSLGKMNITAILTPKGVCVSELLDAESLYKVKAWGLGNISIGAIWYWQYPDPARFFYHKETAEGTFELMKEFLFRLEPVRREVEVAPSHPSSP